MMHSILAHAFIYCLCLAVLVFDPIHEQDANDGNVYPRQMSKTVYNVNIPKME